MVRGSLLVLFQDPFWVGVIERESDGGREVGKVVFGAEPTQAELLVWIQSEYGRLRLTSLGIEAEESAAAPARLRRKDRRKAIRSAREPGTATRAQEALKEALSARAAITEQGLRYDREQECGRRWELRVQKRKRKHRGH